MFITHTSQTECAKCARTRPRYKTEKGGRKSTEQDFVIICSLTCSTRRSGRSDPRVRQVPSELHLRLQVRRSVLFPRPPPTVHVLGSSSQCCGITASQEWHSSYHSLEIRSYPDGLAHISHSLLRIMNHLQ